MADALMLEVVSRRTGAVWFKTDNPNVLDGWVTRDNFILRKAEEAKPWVAPVERGYPTDLVDQMRWLAEGGRTNLHETLAVGADEIERLRLQASKASPSPDLVEYLRGQVAERDDRVAWGIKAQRALGEQYNQLAMRNIQMVAENARLRAAVDETRADRDGLASAVLRLGSEVARQREELEAAHRIHAEAAGLIAALEREMPEVSQRTFLAFKSAREACRGK